MEFNYVLENSGFSISFVVLAIVILLFLRRSRKKEDKIKFVDSKKREDFELQKAHVEAKQEIKVKLVSLEEALTNTKKGFWGRISSSFSGNTIDSSQLDTIEEILYTSDLGPKTVQKLLSTVQGKMDSAELSVDSLRLALRTEMKDIFKNNISDLSMITNKELKNKPEVWMIIGVNGAGKTTTIGKLAHKLAGQDLKVMIAAGDTFRAAAKEQLKIWADRSNVKFFSLENSDSPSGVAYEAVAHAQREGVDICIIDTAGRLHTQTHLMDELKKVKRVMEKAMPGSPHEVLLVLDANSGQNALIQAKEFHDALGVTGVIITKMDGTAKGGVALGVASDLNLSIKLIGVGEKVEDLRTFNPEEFVDSII